MCLRHKLKLSLLDRAIEADNLAKLIYKMALAGMPMSLATIKAATDAAESRMDGKPAGAGAVRRAVGEKQLRVPRPDQTCAPAV